MGKRKSNILSAVFWILYIQNCVLQTQNKKLREDERHPSNIMCV